MSAPTTPAANPYDTKLNRATMAIEVIDTRTGKVVDFFFVDAGGAQTQADARADALWHAELLAAPQVELSPAAPALNPARLAAEAAAPIGACAGCGGSCAADEMYCSSGCLDAMYDEPTAPTPPQPRRAGPDFAELSYLTGPASSHITGNLAEALRQIGPDAELAALVEAALASIGVRCRLPASDVRIVRRWALTQGQAVAMVWWLHAQLQARDSEARPMGLDELGERLRISVERFVGRLNSYAA